MFRKIAMAALPAAAFALIVCATDNSASQAFAKGERGGRGSHNFRHDHRFNNRYFGRYGWGYPTYYANESPACGCGVVCQPEVVTAPVPVAETPVCTTCAPVYSDGYAPYWGWGYGRYRDHFRYDRGHRGHGHSGHGRR